MKFSPEKRIFAEGVIEFDEITCCALAHAFARNEETVQELKKVVSVDELRKMADAISPPTLNIAFKPTEDMKIAYSQIAKKEHKRLSDGDPKNFHCKHTSAQHLTALKSIIKKIEPRLN